MEDRFTQTLLLEQQDKSLFLFVVAVGCTVMFVGALNGETKYLVQRVLFGIVLGVVYSILMRRRFPAYSNLQLIPGKKGESK